MKIVLLEPLGIDREVLDGLAQELTKQGHTFQSFDVPPKDQAEVIARVKDAEVLILANYPLPAETIDACPNLKMISVAFTGYDQVDIETCKEKGITVSNAAGYSTHSVAELVFGFIVSLLRNMPACDTVTREGNTRKGLIGNELHGKTLGIIGTGAIGIRVAEIGKAFGCKLLGTSRSEKKEAIELGLTYTDLDTLLKESDIVTVHTPLTKKTEGLIGKKEFDLMKSSVIVIQAARGGIIDENAFANALDSGKIQGAGIDVFTEEPPLSPDKPLLKARNTIVTPHVAFATREALVKRANIAFENVNMWLVGKPSNKVN